MALPAGRRGVRPDQVKPDGTLNVTEPIPYELPVASAETLGGVKVGSGLSIADGVLSASQYSLPTASAETLGGVKVGSGLSIADGVLSASGGGSKYLHVIKFNSLYCNGFFTIIMDTASVQGDSALKTLLTTNEFRGKYIPANGICKDGNNTIHTVLAVQSASTAGQIAGIYSTENMTLGETNLTSVTLSDVAVFTY